MTADFKKRGAFYTPDDVAGALVAWAVRRTSDHLLDPSCGDGQFLAFHQRSTGIEIHPPAASVARLRSPQAHVYEKDFFAWAEGASERFDCATGNPPFIRYQHFSGETRSRALNYCRSHGVEFSSLTSSWAPFLVAAATLLKPGGRMAFVVPAEIGHAPYARPLLEYFLARFDRVQIVAFRQKLFPRLSEDAWVLLADGFGRRSDEFVFSPMERFGLGGLPPRRGVRVTTAMWMAWNGRLRPFLLPSELRERYRSATESPKAVHVGDVARVGIGYVTGANDFFHLRPSVATKKRIPSSCLKPAVRNGRALKSTAVTDAKVRAWIEADEPVLLLDLAGQSRLPSSVREYLSSIAGEEARNSYKCRTRDPWYAVPDVHVPDGFLSYMSSLGPVLVSNPAGCVATNSVHTVRMKPGHRLTELTGSWNTALRELSCELEGHPLGGGLLKIEPREAARVLVGNPASWNAADDDVAREGVALLRLWRHCG